MPGRVGAWLLAVCGVIEDLSGAVNICDYSAPRRHRSIRHAAVDVSRSRDSKLSRDDIEALLRIAEALRCLTGARWDCLVIVCDLFSFRVWVPDWISAVTVTKQITQGRVQVGEHSPRIARALENATVVGRQSRLFKPLPVPAISR